MAGMAAKMGDTVTGTDTHIIMVPTPSGAETPVPTPSPFVGKIVGGCAANVLIEGKPAAVLGSTARNQPGHIPTGGRFLNPPTNQGTVTMGSATVLINNKPAARSGDKVTTCNDPAPLPVGTITCVSKVLIGG